MSSPLDQRCINTIRTLTADIVQKANSGHPGAPMGMAVMAHALWSKVMRYAPHDPKWPNRDRFVLSNGHACALQYAMLHLTGYEQMTMDQLKKFRTLGSLTPGHPEHHDTQGIEATTGPLGQGIANAVGMALAQVHMAATFNKPGFPLFDNFTYVFCGDGCHQEGLSGEAASLAGHLGLGRLIVLYDDNSITIDGETSLSFTENVPKRFEAYGWHTLTVSGGDNDLSGLLAAIEEAKRVTDKPSLISVKTTIGFGSPQAGTEHVHGSPLGAANLKKAKEALGFNPEESFVVPDEVRGAYARFKSDGKTHAQKWSELFASYEIKHPSEAKELNRRLKGEYPTDWKSILPSWKPTDKPDATRNTSGKVLVALADKMPELIGGSADLTPSNKTQIKSKDFQKATPEGRYIRFGVREHAMAAIGNGIDSYGGLIPFTATFFNFIQYCLPAVRISALAHQHQLYIMTHDSIGVGEDGPTHQPIEALPMCRAIPNVLTFRPADGNETAGSYMCALINKKCPSVLVLSRQDCPQLPNSSAEVVLKGGYVVKDAKDGKADLIYIATGSEVGLAMEAAKKLDGKLNVRVVSMPCTTLFDRQPVSYRRSILTPGVPTISIECAAVQGWDKYAHYSIGMRSFGASAAIKDVMAHFGFVPDKVVASTLNFLNAAKAQGAEAGFSFFGPLGTHFNSAL